MEWATLVERKNRGDYESMIYGVSVKLPDPDAYAYYLGGDSSYWAKPSATATPSWKSCWPLAAPRPTSRRASRFTTRPKTHPGNQPWLFVNWREQAQAYLRKVHGYTQLGGALSESSPGISCPPCGWIERPRMLPSWPGG